ncbi:Hypothetical Protein FCC1311_027042 [Hondaea fermentalgiana]|uniref:Uncharacterized protein n=1 Tax=Hondaea fermentalgiana TaxID=2315210 RepID=A0A2R5GD09_9STRA|nr:Hypothetical Protein FCC1311_027042 [Hondaea fermentalgiana]|eukprot:GBG26483.1 Hypothetical Protein FCC1311_027042 [Hondaea fermentalgiana]
MTGHGEEMRDARTLQARKRMLEEACGGTELSMLDVYATPENPLSVLVPRLLPLRNFTRLHVFNVDLVPDWLKAKKKAPEQLRLWIQDNIPQHDDTRAKKSKRGKNKKFAKEEKIVTPLATENAELAALERLLKRYGSLAGAEKAMQEEEAARKAAQAREARFNLDPLLRRHRLVNMSPQQLQILVIALQNELAACRSFADKCNILRHPLLQAGLVTDLLNGEEAKVFALDPEPAHLIDIAKLHLFTRDARSESDLPLPRDLRSVLGVDHLDAQYIFEDGESDESGDEIDFDGEEPYSSNDDDREEKMETQSAHSSKKQLNSYEQANIIFQRRQHRSVRKQMSWLTRSLSKMQTRIANLSHALKKRQAKHRGRDSLSESTEYAGAKDQEARASDCIHPGAWPTRDFEEATIAQEARQSRALDRMQGTLSRIEERVACDVARMQRELESRDQIIEMQQDIELKLIKSKRETSATNVQLASLVMRMIYHVYPRLWGQLAQDVNVTAADVDDWEEENNAWLQQWIALVTPPSRQDDPQDEAHDSSFKSALHRGMPSSAALGSSSSSSRAPLLRSMTNTGPTQDREKVRSPPVRANTYVFQHGGQGLKEKFASDAACSGAQQEAWMLKGAERERRVSVKAQEQLRHRVKEIVSQPSEKAVGALLDGLVRAVLQYAALLGASPSPAILLDRLQDFSYDVSIIPNLLTQHKVGCAFGLAWAKVRTLEHLEQEATQDKSATANGNATTKLQGSRQARNTLIVRHWLEESARLAFGNETTTPVLKVAQLQHNNLKVTEALGRQSA